MNWIYAIGFLLLMGLFGFGGMFAIKQEADMEKKTKQAQIDFYERLTDKLSKEDANDAHEA